MDPLPTSPKLLIPWTSFNSKKRLAVLDFGTCTLLGKSCEKMWKAKELSPKMGRPFSNSPDRPSAQERHWDRDTQSRIRFLETAHCIGHKYSAFGAFRSLQSKSESHRKTGKPKSVLIPQWMKVEALWKPLKNQWKNLKTMKNHWTIIEKPLKYHEKPLKNHWKNHEQPWKNHWKTQLKMPSHRIPYQLRPVGCRDQRREKDHLTKASLWHPR